MTKLGIDRDTAKRVKEVFLKEKDVHSSTYKINEILRGHGVEYIRTYVDSETKVYGIDYVNMGDLYIPTILFDYRLQSWRVSDVGSIIERHSTFYI